jgi:hypothetical protein
MTPTLYGFSANPSTKPGTQFSGHYRSPGAAEAARQRLAKIILGLAPSDGIPDGELIKYSALVAMRRKESASEALQRARADVGKEQDPLIDAGRWRERGATGAA